jgi:platelet-activating factor acetylhydrolase IB subunit beta/gamma
VSAIPHAQYYDADPGFVKGDGVIDHTDMFDYLHLTRKGYRKFTKRVYDMVNKLLKYD